MLAMLSVALTAELILARCLTPCAASNSSPTPYPPTHLYPEQALLTFQANATDGLCTQAATDATKLSVIDYMQDQPGVNELQVSVTCYNADGSVGGSARRRLQVRRGRGTMVSEGVCHWNCMP